MNEIERLQHLAGIQKPITEDEVTKTAIGHTDDEREMIKKNLYQMGKYCVELYKMMDTIPDNADFPHWWQSKITKALDYISTTKHYLENELAVNTDDAEYSEPVVTDDGADYSDPSGVS
jgi:hypothetical protein